METFNQSLRWYAVALLVIAATLLPTVITYAGVSAVVPDFYEEPGLHPFRDQESQDIVEQIDPFSGSLNLSHTDIVIPGNGGLDIAIKRHYTSNIYVSRPSDNFSPPYPSRLLPRTPYGVGWSMHFGRVTRVTQDASSATVGICDVNTTDPEAHLDNPVLETPDGSQQVLFVNATSDTGINSLFITKQHWVADCITGGLLVTAPDGTKYTMDYDVTASESPYLGSQRPIRTYYTSKIEDRNGNALTIGYRKVGSSSQVLIDQVNSDNDTRSVNFTYAVDTDPLNVRLSTITANGQTWRYYYDVAHGVSTAPGVPVHFQLTEVRLPGSGSLKWKYVYHDKSTAPSAQKYGHNTMKEVTYPHGAKVAYEYAYKDFAGLTVPLVERYLNTVVSRKSVSGTTVETAQWDFDYAPSSSGDVTTVTYPGGKTIYRHDGIQRQATITGSATRDLWRTGLLQEKEVYNESTLIRHEKYTWEGLYKNSNQRFVRLPYKDPNSWEAYFDNFVYAPVLTRKEIIQDGASYISQYSNFNSSYHPQTVTEIGQVTKTTNYSYFPRVAGQNIVGLVEDEWLGSSSFGGTAPNRKIDRTFDSSSANLKQIVRYGVSEVRGYYANGDLRTRRDARGNTTTYSDYHRGIPRHEVHPKTTGVDTIIDRQVNNTGTIRNETNGRENTTAYTYEGLNRVKTIDLPRQDAADISVDYTSSTKVVTRGYVTQTTYLDGFGRSLCRDTTDTLNSVNTAVAQRYDAFGRVEYESYPFSGACPSYGGALPVGTTTNHDVLGRPTLVTHADGTFRTIQNLVGNTEQISNERGYRTTNTYRSYGDPDNRELMRSDQWAADTALGDSANEIVATIYTRNILGQIETVQQGATTRQYIYDPTNATTFLKTVNDPETGATQYGRDELGNMTSRQVGNSGVTTYFYDFQNHQTFVDYPGTTPDVTLGYDNNGNLESVQNAIAMWTYQYDRNDNLYQELLDIDGRRYINRISYDQYDYVGLIRSPAIKEMISPRDGLGRVISLLPIISSVTSHPNGQPNVIVYGNGTQTVMGLNTRQWVDTINTTGGAAGTVVDLQYPTYDGRGNINSIADNLIPANSRSMAYDGLGRLKAAAGSWGSGVLTYDATGNILTKNIGATNLSYIYGGTNNRLTGVTGSQTIDFLYDDYGNITGNANNSFTYDDAGNLNLVDGGATATYGYDGNNRRVKKQENGKTIYSFYSRNGNLVGEYPTVGDSKEYYYLNQKLVGAVTYTAPGVPGALVVPATSNTGDYSITFEPVAGSIYYVYYLEEATSSDFSDAVRLPSNKSSTPTSFSITAKAEGTYYYRVQVCSRQACSDYRVGSNPIVVTHEALGIPPYGTATNSNGIDTITWGASTGNVSYYELYYTGWPPYFWQPINALIYSGPDLTATFNSGFLATYWRSMTYKVRACGSGQCSDFLNIQAPPPDSLYGGR